MSRAGPGPTRRGLAGLAAAAALASCGASSSLPAQDTATVIRAVEATLAACTRPLGADGNISEAALAQAGWSPTRRTLSTIVNRNNDVGSEQREIPPARPAQLGTVEESEYSEWTHPGWEGELDLSRQGGALSERAMGQCRASFRGRDSRTADQAFAAMTRRLGAPVGRSERSRGGDWLTPRWFEPTIHEAYWRLPAHDVYWVSSNAREVTVEVRAMPDRSQLDQWSPDRPSEQYRTREGES